MARFDRLRARLLRLDAVLSLTAIALPFVAAMVLGFVWLFQQGYFLWFVGISAGLGGAVWLVLFAVRRTIRRREAQGVGGAAPPPDGVPPDPDWGVREAEAFATARRTIRARLTAPLPWDEMQDLALEVVSIVASKSGAPGKTRDRLNFSLPEALLLIERVASRYRADLRSLAPFLDSLSLDRVMWLWRNRVWAHRAVQAGHGLWRVIRLAKNPPVGLMQEVERLLANGHAGHLTTEGMTFAQTILMEEVAKAAVDLYSGRLRFSDSELLAIRRADGRRDDALRATPDAPVRIAIAGQISAGKSTLVNALLDSDAAETDAPPTTHRATTHRIDLRGTPCVLVDLPGVDGSAAVSDTVLAEMNRSDLVVWHTRANRPARAVDAGILERWRREGAARGRRMPPLVSVLSCADTLIADWPFAENDLPHEAAELLNEAVQAAARDLDTGLPIPVCAEAPVWNLDYLLNAMAAQMGEALMVQRSRARRSGEETGTGTEIVRGARGLARAARGLGARWLSHRDETEREK